MAAKTGIEWTDSTWSPIRYRVKADAAQICADKGYSSLWSIANVMAGRVGQHCEHVSPGCNHCYAESNNHRCLPANGTGLPYDRRARDLVEPFIDEKILLQPLLWKPVVEHVPSCDFYLADRKNIRNCGCPTRPRRIFVENQSDLFGEWVSDELLDRVFAVMALCPQHTFQVLTKRPARMLAYLTGVRNLPGLNDGIPITSREAIGLTMVGMISEDLRIARIVNKTPGGDVAVSAEEGCEGSLSVWPLPNVWLGVSAENQAAADERIPLLLQTPAAVRFISAEPLLGEIHIEHWLTPLTARWPSVAFGEEVLPELSWSGAENRKLDWVIAGGESGPNARPMHPDWARGLRDQCQAAGMPFFFKQWGEWRPHPTWVPSEKAPAQIALGCDGKEIPHDVNPDDVGGQRFLRVGKKAAGSLLDGVEHKAFPGVHP